MKKQKHISLGFSQRKNDSVGTPSYLYDYLHQKYSFDFDPCPLDSKEDLLNKDWGKTTYVNPPYSRVRDWVKRGVEWCREEDGRTVVFLIPYRGHSKYWREWVFPYAKNIKCLTKQIVFDGYQANFPVPLTIVVFTTQSCRERRKEKVVVTKSIIKKRTKATIRYFTLK